MLVVRCFCDCFVLFLLFVGLLAVFVCFMHDLFIMFFGGEGGVVRCARFVLVLCRMCFALCYCLLIFVCLCLFVCVRCCFVLLFVVCVVCCFGYRVCLFLLLVFV